MNRDWKPGDVAIARWKHFPGVPAMFTPRGWIDVDNARFDGHEDDLTLRALVVIDPENAEQVEKLWVALRDHRALQSRGNLLAALREFADPTPRIEEPTGLGAVVEDADGMRWLRGHGDPGFYVWRDQSDVIGRRFSDLKNVVRVLSDGAPS